MSISMFGEEVLPILDVRRGGGDVATENTRLLGERWRTKMTQARDLARAVAASNQ